MRSSRAFTGVAVLLITLFSPMAAHALDIPLLTWERGKEQNLVLGGNTDNEWKIELLDEANEPVLEFTASDISANGFIVYSVFVPQDFPLGAYAVRATGLGIPSSIVAGINVVSLSFYEVVQIPIELLTIFLAYIFVTVGLGVLRIRRHASIFVKDIAELDVDRIPSALLALARLRERASANLDPSLFQLLLRREGHWLRSRSLTLWSLLPLAAFVVGLLIGIEVLRSGSLGSAPWIFLFLGAVITAVDLYSGIMSFAGFILAQLIFGDVVSLRDVMVLFAVGLAWSGAYAIGAVFMALHESRNSGLAKGVPSFSGLLVGAIAAAAIFLASQILILSLVVTVTEPVGVTWELSLMVGLLTVARHMIEPKLEPRVSDGQELSSSTWIVVGRVLAPKSVAFLAAFFMGTLFIWLRDWLSAITLALALVLPFAMLLVRFRGPKFKTLSRLPRSGLIESTLLTVAGFLIFRLMQDQPFEVLERSRLFLVLAVIPVLIHSLYSMLWDVAERAELISDIRDESELESEDA